MGQYFIWLNPVRKQYLDPYHFDYGCKRRESSGVGNGFLNALFTLMDNEWKGDPIVWIGDTYARLHNETNPTLKITEEICGDDPFNYACEHFENLAHMFSNCIKSHVVTDYIREDVLKNYGLNEEEIERYFEFYSEENAVPFWSCRQERNFEEFLDRLIQFLEEKGMFKREALPYRFIINNSRKEFIDTERIAADEDGYRYNPFPALMIKEDSSDVPFEKDENSYCGLWLGDSITVSNNPDDIPDNYEDVSNRYTWENG